MSSTSSTSTESDEEVNFRSLKWSRFKLITEIGKGSFGEIWLGKYFGKDDKEDSSSEKGKRVAVKFEIREGKKRFWLLKEARIMMRLNRKKVKNVPKVFWYGVENGFNIMVMELLSESLLDIKCRLKRFSLKTCLRIGLTLIDILEKIHSYGYLHCDIKPSNLLLKGEDNQDFYLIDFGLSKEYMKDGKHYDYKKKSKKNKSITGTALFCSITTHRGNLSRRDDLESIGFVMLYFLRGSLPWQGIRGETKYEKYDKIYHEKLRTKKTLCEDVDKEFTEYFKYVRSLKFDQQPDYEYLRGILHYLMIKKKMNIDGKEFDWIEVEKEIYEPEKTDSVDSEEEQKGNKNVYYVNNQPSFWKWFFNLE